MENKTETLLKWQKPMIEVKEIFEKTALNCDGSPFNNQQTNPKQSAGSCGYWYS
ncbi:MAG: hypothetical protein V1733_03420 [bacterium]